MRRLANEQPTFPMNRIYRLVFNCATALCQVVCCELGSKSQGHGAVPAQVCHTHLTGDGLCGHWRRARWG
ncbi:ESPR-type extended signal peptide-containing protein [Pseudomonas fluorescens]|uniref:ESPR-type extended signal peptide-containing protein n=1 Tax=Pseudomonas fluorescens TaxID=294 RepID=UPI00346160C0